MLLYTCSGIIILARDSQTCVSGRTCTTARPRTDRTPRKYIIFLSFFFSPSLSSLFFPFAFNKTAAPAGGCRCSERSFFRPSTVFFFIIILEPILPDILLLHNPGPFRKVKFRFVFYFIKYCFLRPLPRLPRPSVKNFARFLFPPLPSPPGKIYVTPSCVHDNIFASSLSRPAPYRTIVTDGAAVSAHELSGDGYARDPESR